MTVESSDDIQALSSMPEGQYFDRKSARIKVKDVARHITALPMLQVVNWRLASRMMVKSPDFANRVLKILMRWNAAISWNASLRPPLRYVESMC